MDERPTLDYITPYPRRTRWTACTPERDGILPAYVNHERLARDKHYHGGWLQTYLVSAYPTTISN